MSDCQQTCADLPQVAKFVDIGADMCYNRLENSGAECFSAEKGRMDALTAPDLGNANEGTRVDEALFFCDNKIAISFDLLRMPYRVCAFFDRRQALSEK